MVMCQGREREQATPGRAEMENGNTKQIKECLVSLVLLPPISHAGTNHLIAVSSGVPCTV